MNHYSARSAWNVAAAGRAAAYAAADAYRAGCAAAYAAANHADATTTHSER